MRRVFSSGRQGLVAAMEEETRVAELAEGGDAEATELAENNAETTEAVAEVAESTEEGAVAEDAKEEAVETVEALESIAIALRTSAANGGMDKHSAHVVSIAVEHMYSRIGVSRKAMPAMESFGGTSTRVGATQLALEGITQSIKDIWAAIVKAVKKAVQWVKDHFFKVFGAAEKLKKRADAVKAKAGAVTTKPKEKTFDNKSLVEKLQMEGTVKADESGVKNLAIVVKAVFDQYAATSGKAGEEIADALEKTDKATATLAIPGSVELSVLTDGNASKVADAPGGCKVQSSVELPGGKSLQRYVATERTMDNVTKEKVFLGPFNKDGKAPTSEQVTTLAANTCEAIAKTVGEIADAIISYRAQFDKVLKIKDRIVKAAEKIGKEAESGDTKVEVGAGQEATDKKGALQQAQKLAAHSMTMMDFGTKDLGGYAVNTGNALLNYVEASLSHYESK